MISTTTKYAVNALEELAKGDKETFVGIDILSKQIDVPRPYLAKILKKLAAKGIILSKKGLNGGFKLPERKKTLTLYDLCILLDDPVARQSCFLEKKTCGAGHHCSMHKQWGAVNSKVIKFLKDYKLN